MQASKKRQRDYGKQLIIRIQFAQIFTNNIEFDIYRRTYFKCVKVGNLVCKRNNSLIIHWISFSYAPSSIIKNCVYGSWLFSKY